MVRFQATVTRGIMIFVHARSTPISAVGILLRMGPRKQRLPAPGLGMRCLRESRRWLLRGLLEFKRPDAPKLDLHSGLHLLHKCPIEQKLLA